MDADTMKPFGFSEYPDWRWRCVMRNIKRIGDACTAEEYFSDPGEEALLEDETLALFAFPYLRQRLYPDAGDAMSEERGLAMMLALRAANEEYITSRSDSLNLEAGVLGGRARGELLVNPGEMTPPAQIVYERLFCDVRPFLSDTAAVCRLLFRDQERVHARGGYDLICKITAYALGFDEYQQWRCGSPSDRVHMLHFATDSLVRYCGEGLLIQFFHWECPLLDRAMVVGKEGLKLAHHSFGELIEGVDHDGAVVQIGDAVFKDAHQRHVDAGPLHTLDAVLGMLERRRIVVETDLRPAVREDKQHFAFLTADGEFPRGEEDGLAQRRQILTAHMIEASRGAAE